MGMDFGVIVWLLKFNIYERKPCCICGYVERYVYPVGFGKQVYCDECILSGKAF